MKDQMLSKRGQFTINAFQRRFEIAFPYIRKMLCEKRSYREIVDETGLAVSTISVYIGCSSELSGIAKARGERRGGARK